MASYKNATNLNLMRPVNVDGWLEFHEVIVPYFQTQRCKPKIKINIEKQEKKNIISTSAATSEPDLVAGSMKRSN
jgi:hypothetical protein